MTAVDPTLLVVSVLRLKGFAEADVIAGCSGLRASDVEQQLEKLAADELATHREGRVAGWALTASGRARHAELVRDEIEGRACRAAIDAAYQSFLGINTSLLSLCTDWQMRTDRGDQTLNDHSDADYDAGVIAGLGALDDTVQPICAEISSHLARFAGYGPRLAEARVKLEGGDKDWFTKPLIDSYHTVWFELHEDLLCTLGIERAAEGSA